MTIFYWDLPLHRRNNFQKPPSSPNSLTKFLLFRLPSHALGIGIPPRDTPFTATPVSPFHRLKWLPDWVAVFAVEDRYSLSIGITSLRLSDSERSMPHAEPLQILSNERIQFLFRETDLPLSTFFRIGLRSRQPPCQLSFFRHVRFFFCWFSQLNQFGVQDFLFFGSQYGGVNLEA